MSGPIHPISTQAVRDELVPRLMRDGDDEAWDVVESLCVTVDRVREQLMNTQESLRRLMRHLDDTADGLGDWHDGTEYVEWARSEVQKIYATVVKSGVLE